ncbi:hypothetical protein [Alienimonas chondri]|uniref:Uncharacterized protein n=1 Tax=Alienimonas chondri TaxID=2681879 RepID=A0ABX1VHJ1_9PLAN|nr:hypothetical protein [Alienimonas chondri]NNJ27609.1 hypothetical protein [Alienimonas chondri]
MPADRPRHADRCHILGASFGGPIGWATAVAGFHWQTILAGDWGRDSLEGMLVLALPAGLVAGAAGATAAERFAARRLAPWPPLATSFGGAWAGGIIAAAALLVVGRAIG